MRRGNWIVFAIATVVSLFLVWLWFYLGFNKVDSPLDLLLAVGWWVIMAALVLLIRRTEVRRCGEIRTIYVSPSSLFNIETGEVDCEPAERVAKMEELLLKLDYEVKKERSLPGVSDFDYAYVVRSEEFAVANEKDGEKGKDGKPIVAGEVDDRLTWKGKVIKIDRHNGNEEVPFEDKAQLQAIFA